MPMSFPYAYIRVRDPMDTAPPPPRVSGEEWIGVASSRPPHRALDLLTPPNPHPLRLLKAALAGKYGAYFTMLNHRATVCPRSSFEGAALFAPLSPRPPGSPLRYFSP